MAWGGGGLGVDDWVKRLADNDPKLTSIHVFKSRRFGTEEVKALCEALRFNTTLKELYASGHALDQEATSAVSEMLSVNSTLTSLCVGDTDFSDTGVAVLVSGLQRNKSLTHLDFEGKSITDIGARALKDAITGSGCLQTLNLSRNAIGDAGMTALVEGLKTAPSLHTLDLRECSLGVQAGAALGDLLACPDCHISRLQLEGNSGLGAEGVTGLAAGLEASTSLEHLDLTLSGCGDNGARALGKSVRRAIHLKELKLTQCNITPVGGQEFVKEFFRPCDENVDAKHSLQILNLAGNELDEEAVNALANALSTCAFLEAGLHLDLSGSRVDTGCLTSLAAVNQLSKLRLFSCALGDAVAFRLAELLKEDKMSGIEYLDLCGAGIGLEGLRSIFDALKEGSASNLKVLEVGANPGTQDDTFEALLNDIRQVRIGLDVVWKTSDPGDNRE